MDELLKLLRDNALESTENLAKMLAISEDEVRAKVAAYEQAGVIRGYHAMVNDEKLDIPVVRAAIEVRITPERVGGFNRVAQRVGKFPEVESLFLMSGGYDLLVFVKGSNLQEVAGFVSDKLATIEGVLSTATHFMLRTFKDQSVLMQQDEENDERLTVSP